ncbi:MAG: hypothetical protein V5A43_03220 [Haloarculaceae archaeon]
MATRSIADISEECSTCGRITTHHVGLEIQVESTRDENAEFSREPYRVSECHVCGDRRSTRMNNA